MIFKVPFKLCHRPWRASSWSGVPIGNVVVRWYKKALNLFPVATGVT